MLVCERVRGINNPLDKRTHRKGKTVNLNIDAEEKKDVTRSNKRIYSIKKLLMEDYDLSEGFKMMNTVDVKIFAIR